MPDKFTKTALLSVLLMAFAPGAVLGQAVEKKGTTPYVTHFVFRPVQSLEVGGVGTATLLEAVGTTQNTKGEKMLDKMAARCMALNIDSGGKKYIDGACALTDKDGDVIFSTFDTRDLDKSQPQMSCGTQSSPAEPESIRASRGASRSPARPCLSCRHRRLFRPRHSAQLDMGDQISAAPTWHDQTAPNPTQLAGQIRERQNKMMPG